VTPALGRRTGGTTAGSGVRGPPSVLPVPKHNISPTDGKTVDDHLEFVLKNTGSKPLDQVEVYYRISGAPTG